MGQKIDRTYLFERMPVGQAVRRQIVPSIASQMVILLYNLADTYFVGLLNDAAQTAAVSLAYSVTLLMTALANLFAVGGAGRIAADLARLCAGCEVLPLLSLRGDEVSAAGPAIDRWLAQIGLAPDRAEGGTAR